MKDDIQKFIETITGKNLSIFIDGEGFDLSYDCINCHVYLSSNKINLRSGEISENLTHNEFQIYIPSIESIQFNSKIEVTEDENEDYSLKIITKDIAKICLEGEIEITICEYEIIKENK